MYPSPSLGYDKHARPLHTDRNTPHPQPLHPLTSPHWFSLFPAFQIRRAETPESHGSPGPTTAGVPADIPGMARSDFFSCPSFYSSFHGNSCLSGQRKGATFFNIMIIEKLSRAYASCYGSFHGNPSHRHINGEVLGVPSTEPKKFGAGGHTTALPQGDA